MALVQLISLGQRTTTQYSPLVSAIATRPTNAKGLWLYVNVTAIVDTPSITPRVRARDGAGNGYDLWIAAAALASTGPRAYFFRWDTSIPSPAAVGDVIEVVDRMVPENWDLEITHSDADAIDYECYCEYVGHSS
jgi:hypothetical protein